MLSFLSGLILSLALLVETSLSLEEEELPPQERELSTLTFSGGDLCRCEAEWEHLYRRRAVKEVEDANEQRQLTYYYHYDYDSAVRVGNVFMVEGIFVLSDDACPTSTSTLSFLPGQDIFSSDPTSTTSFSFLPRGGIFGGSRKLRGGLQEATAASIHEENGEASTKDQNALRKYFTRRHCDLDDNRLICFRV